MQIWYKKLIPQVVMWAHPLLVMQKYVLKTVGIILEMSMVGIVPILVSVRLGIIGI